MEQLLAMPFDEVLELLPSRSRRTYLRGLNYEQQLLFDNLKGRGRRTGQDPPQGPARSFRSSSGRPSASTTGHEFKDVEIKPEMIGHLLGEFVINRKMPQHSGPGVGATQVFEVHAAEVRCRRDGY
jgi:small subunit ribosomal protein S19